jgi:hypothetical protein
MAIQLFCRFQEFKLDFDQAKYRPCDDSRLDSYFSEASLNWRRGSLLSRGPNDDSAEAFRCEDYAEMLLLTEIFLKERGVNEVT